MRPTTTYIAITGVVLARLRRLAGLQQAEAGAQVGVNQSSWSKIERGVIGITVEYLAILAPTLKAEPNEVLAAVDRVARYAEQRGVQVLRNREDLVGEALQSQLSAQALAAMVEAVLA